MQIVNPVEPTDLAAWSATLRATFLSAPDPKRDEQAARFWAERLDPARTWGVRDGGRFVATLGTETRVLTVPAAHGTAEIAVDALTGVTVSGTHRRRGILTGMITASLAAARERGDALSYLVAAEWPIYGRFGYAPATRSAQYRLHTLRPGARLRVPAEAVRPIDATELAEVGPALGDRARRRTAGDLDRLPSAWRSQLQDDPREGRVNIVVHDGPDGVDGLVTWKPGRDFDIDATMGSIEVVDLIAATDEAYLALWGYLLGVDLVDEVRLPHRPVDEPVRHALVDGRTLQTTFAGDFTWLCLLDVPTALTGRGYPVGDRLVLDVVDTSVTGYATGRWLLDAGPDGVSCTPTTRSPDLTLPASSLASAYLGDHPLAQTYLGAGPDEHTTGAARRFDTLFSTPRAPFCSTGF